MSCRPCLTQPEVPGQCPSDTFLEASCTQTVLASILTIISVNIFGSHPRWSQSISTRYISGPHSDFNSLYVPKLHTPIRHTDPGRRYHRLHFDRSLPCDRSP